MVGVALQTAEVPEATIVASAAVDTKRIRGRHCLKQEIVPSKEVQVGPGKANVDYGTHLVQEILVVP